MKLKSLILAALITFSGALNAQKLAAIAKKGSQYGFIDQTGNWLIQPRFDAVQTFKGDYALAKVKEKWGIIDKTGNWVIEAKFERLNIPEDGYAMAMLGGEWLVVDAKGNTVYKNSEYRSIDKLGNGMLIAYQKKYADYIDVSTGSVVKPPVETKDIGQFSDGLARVKDGKWGYIDKTGKFKINAQFEDAKDFEGGKAKVKMNGKWGYINTSGEWVINAECDDIKGFSDGTAIAKKGGKFGIISEDGKWVVNPEFEKLREFNSGFAFATKDGADGYVKVGTNEFIKAPANATTAYPFSDGYAMIRIGEQIGYIGKDMNVVIDAKYPKAMDWGGDLGRVMENEMWVFVNDKGEIKKIDGAQKLYKPHGGLAAVKVNDRYGYVDMSGEMVIKPEYMNIEDEYLYNAMAKGGWGMFAAAVYEEPNRDKHGFILVQNKAGKYGEIDKTGKTVIPFDFDDLKAFYEF